MESIKDSYAILQLRSTEETKDEQFIGYTRLELLGKKPNPTHYKVVYVGELTPGISLEDLYIKFNIGCPLSFTGHSLSVSDIIALKQDGNTTYHYVDSIGFRELSNFRMPELEKDVKG